MDQTFTIKVSVYNEEVHLVRVYQELHHYIESRCIKTGAVCVNNASNEGSIEAIQNNYVDHSSLPFIDFDENYSLSAPMPARLRHVTSTCLGNIDADLQTINSEFAQRILALKRLYHFISAMILSQGDTTKQVLVSHFERISGTAKFALWNKLIEPLMDSFACLWMKKIYFNYHKASNR